MQFSFQIWILLFLLGTYLAFVKVSGQNTCDTTNEFAENPCTPDTHAACVCKWDGEKWAAPVCALAVKGTPGQCTGKGKKTTCQATATASKFGGCATSCTHTTCNDGKSATSTCDGTNMCQKENPLCKATKKASSKKRSATEKTYEWFDASPDSPGCVYGQTKACDPTTGCIVAPGNKAEAAITAATCACFDGDNSATEAYCDGTNKCKTKDPVCTFAKFKGKTGWHPDGEDHGCAPKGKMIVNECFEESTCVLKPQATAKAVETTICDTKCKNPVLKEEPTVASQPTTSMSSRISSLGHLTFFTVILTLLNI